MKTTKELNCTFFWECEEDDVVLDGLKRFTYDYLDNGMDGIFPNKASWTKFLKRVEAGELCNWLSYKRKNWYVKAIDYNTIEVYSALGFNVSTGFIYENGEKKYIYDKYNKLKIKLDYNYLFSMGQDKATAIEIYGTIIWGE